MRFDFIHSLKSCLLSLNESLRLVLCAIKEIIVQGNLLVEINFR